MNNLNFSQPDSLKYINRNITYRNISTIQDLNLKNETNANKISERIINSVRIKP